MTLDFRPLEGLREAQQMKKTLIIGASSNPERYAYKAAEKLLRYGHPIEMIGRKSEMIFEKMIDVDKKPYSEIDTVTMYLSPKFQAEYYDYVISLRPHRVVFNPGTENPEFELLLQSHGIVTDRACTLVLLGTGQY